MEVMKEFKFEASHVLPKHKGKCSRLHGHSWVLRVFVRGGVNKDSGFVVDFADIKADVQPLIDQLDHKHLGAWSVKVQNGFVLPIVEGWNVPDMDIYPTSENLLWWIGEQLYRQGLQWHALELNETCTSMARLEISEFITRFQR